MLYNAQVVGNQRKRFRRTGVLQDRPVERRDGVRGRAVHPRGASIRVSAKVHRRRRTISHTSQSVFKQNLVSYGVQQDVLRVCGTEADRIADEHKRAALVEIETAGAAHVLLGEQQNNTRLCCPGVDSRKRFCPRGPGLVY